MCLVLECICLNWHLERKTLFTKIRLEMCCFCYYTNKMAFTMHLKKEDFFLNFLFCFVVVVFFTKIPFDSA